MFGYFMLDQMKACVKDELDAVLLEIQQATRSDIPLIQSIQQYILHQPEKKLIRPLILLLFSKAIGYQTPDVTSLAAIIEMIHGATLLHDDIIDKADTRRNQPTTHKQFGTSQSVLMGDFIYACVFQLIAKLNQPKITDILSRATKEIVEGEILQLSLTGNPNIRMQDYQQIIRAKTALLFSSGIACLAHLAQQPDTLSHYGYHFGMLYQMTDDILDIDVQNPHLNKSHGTDLKEGKMTLPVMLAYQHSPKKDQAIIESILAQKTPWQAILPILEKTNAFNLCTPYLNQHIQLGIQALDPLTNSPYKTHLIHLLTQIPKRKR